MQFRGSSLVLWTSVVYLIVSNCAVVASADAQPAFGCAGKAIIGSFETSGGDAGPAAKAQLFNPGQMAVDTHGNVYIVDTSNERIRVVSSSGTISTLAGNGIAASTGDGGPAAKASLNRPSGVAVDGAGSVYISESNGNRIRKISPDGMISTFAGNGHVGFSGDSGSASSAIFDSPRGLAIDPQGNLFVSDYWNLRVRRIAPDGTITTVVGGASCCSGTPIDGALGTSIRYGGDSLAIAANGNLLISINGVVAYLDSSGILHDITSESYPGTPPAEGANARQAAMNAGSIAAAADGSIFVLSYGTIWQIQPNGLLHDVSNYSENFLTVAAAPGGLVLGAAVNSVYSFSKSGQRTVFAGVETVGFSGDGGPAAAAQLSWIGGVAVDKGGSIYLSDPENNRVRRVTTDGLISTFAGTGEEKSGGDGGPASAAQIYFPQALAFDPFGNLYVAEEDGGGAFGDNQESAFVRKIAPDGTITRFAGGNGPFSPGCFFGCIPQTGKALDADLGVIDIASDGKGQIYLLDLRALDIWKIDLEGNISYFASQLPIQRGGEYGQIRFDPSGNLYWLSPWPGITTGLFTVPPNQQPVNVSTRTYPQSFAFDAKGNLYYSGLTGEIYKQTPAGGVSTLFYNVSPETISTIYPITTDSSGNLYFADQARNRLFEIPNAASCVGPQPPLTNKVFNAASYSLGIAPGELVTFFGFFLGPAQGVGPSIIGGNRFDTQAGGVRVLFDGVPAPVLYASAGQVSAVVPYSVAGASVTAIEVEVNGLASDPINASVFPAAPGIFTRDSSGQGQAAAQNQDSTPNGPSHPAPKGSTIVIFATGAGVTTPASLDGVIAGASPPKPVLPVTATVGGQLAHVAYAGGAPFEINGILQVNIVIPASSQSGPAIPISIQVGTAQSQDGVTVAIQ
jgi:uncharacterized protein (TIGR03437 family)